MTDYNIAQGQTNTVGQQNGNTGTVSGNANQPYGMGGGRLVTTDWNGGTATVVGGTLEVDANFNGTFANLRNATFLLKYLNANGASFTFSGTSRLILSWKAASSGSLEDINLKQLGPGDRIEVIGAMSGGIGSPTFNHGKLSFNIGGRSYSVNASLASGVTANFTYGFDAQSGCYYVGLASALPTVRITSPAEASDQAARTITGTATSAGGGSVVGRTVTLTDNGQQLGTTTVGMDGSFSFAATLPYAGANSIVASVQDSNGNVGTSEAVVDTLTAAPTTQTGGGAPATQTRGDAGGTLPAGSAATPAGSTGSTDPTGPNPPSTSLSGSSPSGTATGPTAPANPSAPTVAIDPELTARGAVVHLTGTAGAADGSNVVSVDLFQGTTNLGAARLKADGTWSFSFTADGTYETDIHAVATDSAGQQATAQGPFNILHTGTTQPGYATRVDRYDPVSGLYAGSDYLRRDGDLYLQTQSLALPRGGSRVTGADGSYFDDKSYASYVNTYDAAGDLVTWVENETDGTHRSEIVGDGRMAQMNGSDTIWDEGHGTRFVFKPGVGQETIYGFQASGNGHDVVSLPGTDTTRLDQILASAQADGQGGTAIRLGRGDTITFVGVSVADLQNNAADFRLRG